MPLASDYPIVLSWSQPDVAWIAVCPAFPGLAGESVNPEDAVEELIDAIAMACQILTETGGPIPPRPSWQIHAGPEGYDVAWLREDGTWGWTARREAALDALSDAAAGLDVAPADSGPDRAEG